jgi:hypothetical protein
VRDVTQTLGDACSTVFRRAEMVTGDHRAHMGALRGALPAAEKPQPVPTYQPVPPHPFGGRAQPLAAVHTQVTLSRFTRR